MIEIFDCPQNSPEWLEVRRGIPTASEFKTIIGVKKDAKDKATRAKYMRKLAGEIITKEPMSKYTNSAMDRGHAMEAEARNFYAFLHDCDPQLVGFVRNGNTGSSPDSLINANGVLEIKTAEADILIDYLMADRFPPEHVAQCQGNLLVTEREWIDICIYWPKLPPLIKRAYRDKSYIAMLSDAIVEFNYELEMLVDRIKRYGAPIAPSKAD